jgi:putative membrane protein
MLYLWLKTLHLVAMVCWFAGLFYLPRLFVYHAECTDAAGRERFVIMERRLYRGIMTPAMLATLLFGLGLVSLHPSYYLHIEWFHWKIGLLILLFGFHGFCGKYRTAFATELNHHSSKFFRGFNEIPTILLVAIIYLAVMKPSW